jgi:hypothetical protein
MNKTGSNRAAWDWNGIVGTGQSLSVGTTPITSTAPSFGNLKLSLGPAGNEAVPPWNPDLPDLSMVPLVEPIRPMTEGYPRPYPGNIYGETPHSAMASQITALASRREAERGEYVSVHTVVGESGQGITALARQTGSTTGITGRAYAATLFEVRAIARLAREAGKTYGVGAIVMTHGETDSGNPEYESALVALLADYRADLLAITGQSRPIAMYISQQHAFPNGPASAGQRPLATQVPWRLGVTRPRDFVCVGPKYQLSGHPNGDGVHLSATAYQLLGEKIGAIYYQREVLGADWQPLQPISVRRSGRVVTVRFHVPVPPLEWDTTLDAPLLPEWARARGFELWTGSERIAIRSAEISSDAVNLTAERDLPASGLFVGYALASQGVQLSTASQAVRWGQLRDSDPLVGATTGVRNPNYCVSFELPVP